MFYLLACTGPAEVTDNCSSAIIYNSVIIVCSLEERSCLLSVPLPLSVSRLLTDAAVWVDCCQAGNWSAASSAGGRTFDDGHSNTVQRAERVVDAHMIKPARVTHFLFSLHPHTWIWFSRVLSFVYFHRLLFRCQCDKAKVTPSSTTSHSINTKSQKLMTHMTERNCLQLYFGSAQ